MINTICPYAHDYHLCVKSGHTDLGEAWCIHHCPLRESKVQK